MEMTPSTPPTKRTRAKSEASASVPTITVKTRKSRAAPKPVQPLEEVVIASAEPAAPVAEDLTGLIATTAYFLAAERNFAPGHELDDWLEAERRVTQAAK